ncbi:MAG TPA: hypothetical protein VG408_08165 [Actinomycetota bacterium]|nr:hypothetical protein [Actinomycetota bacterium]
MSDRHGRQIVGSLLAAVVIVAIVIALVVARVPLDRLPPEDREERLERLEDEREDNSGSG